MGKEKVPKATESRCKCPGGARNCRAGALYTIAPTLPALHPATGLPVGTYPLRMGVTQVAWVGKSNTLQIR